MSRFKSGILKRQPNEVDENRPNLFTDAERGSMDVSINGVPLYTTDTGIVKTLNLNLTNLNPNISGSYLAAFLTYWPSYFGELFNEKYLLIRPSMHLEYTETEQDLLLDLTATNVQFSPLIFYDNTPKIIKIPGSLRLSLKRIDDNEYQIMGVYASTLALEALIEGQYHDLQHQEFQQYLQDSPFLTAANRVKQELFAKTSRANNQMVLPISLEAAENILSASQIVHQKQPHNTSILIDLLNVTYELLHNPQQVNHEQLQRTLYSVHRLNSRWASPLTGSLLILLGGSLFVGAALAAGPAGIGIWGIGLAFKLMKIYVAQHLVLSTMSTVIAASGLPLLLFGGSSTAIRQLDHQAYTLEKSVPQQNQP